MNVQNIPRGELFEHFKKYMYERDAEDTLLRDEDSLFGQYEKEFRKAREQQAAENLAKEKEKEAAK